MKKVCFLNKFFFFSLLFSEKMTTHSWINCDNTALHVYLLKLLGTNLAKVTLKQEKNMLCCVSIPRSNGKNSVQQIMYARIWNRSNFEVGNELCLNMCYRKAFELLKSAGKEEITICTLDLCELQMLQEVLQEIFLLTYSSVVNFFTHFEQLLTKTFWNFFQSSIMSMLIFITV